MSLLPLTFVTLGLPHLGTLLGKRYEVRTATALAFFAMSALVLTMVLDGAGNAFGLNPHEGQCAGSHACSDWEYYLGREHVDKEGGGNLFDAFEARPTARNFHYRRLPASDRAKTVGRALMGDEARFYYLVRGRNGLDFIRKHGTGKKNATVAAASASSPGTRDGEEPVVASPPRKMIFIDKRSEDFYLLLVLPALSWYLIFFISIVASSALTAHQIDSSQATGWGIILVVLLLASELFISVDPSVCESFIALYQPFTDYASRLAKPLSPSLSRRLRFVTPHEMVEAARVWAVGLWASIVFIATRYISPASEVLVARRNGVLLLALLHARCLALAEGVIRRLGGGRS